MKSDFPDFVPQEVCLSCEGCCRFQEPESLWRPKVALSEQEEFPRIFSNENIDQQKSIQTSNRNGNYVCFFFNPSANKCTIYEIRPFECQLYPFLLLKSEEELMLGVHLNCPYVQESCTTDIFEKIVQELKDYFQKDEMITWLGENCYLCGEYLDDKKEIKELFRIPIS